MSVVDKAKDQLGDLVGTVLGGPGRTGHPQTVTIDRPRAEIEQFWRDPERLSTVFRGIAEVRAVENGRYEWRLVPGGGSVTWVTALTAEAGCVRFTAIGEPGTQSGPGLRVDLRTAPHDLGTEVTLTTSTAAPDVLTDPVVYTVLYRARALLQTGEVPTLAHNPSARSATTG